MAGVVGIPILALAAAGCGSGSAITTTPPPAEIVVVPEAWITAAEPGANFDSPAVWTGEGRAWVLVTAKQADEILAYDAADGSPSGRFGRSGGGIGRLERPNGVAVVGDVMLIVERDNARVQAVALPTFEPLAVAGADALRRPYGIAVRRLGPGRHELFVTDNYVTPDGAIPPDHELGDRVRRFLLEIAGNFVSFEAGRAFGDTDGAGVLRKVESIAVDPRHGLVLVADEQALVFKGYTVEGAYTGVDLGGGVLEAEPEGIALYACGDAGYWIVTDQHDALSVFHVFDRATFTWRGGFTGERTANTDGVALTQTPIGDRFPAGAFYAIHDDRAVAAFSWASIAAALSLRDDCAA